MNPRIPPWLAGALLAAMFASVAAQPASPAAPASAAAPGSYSEKGADTCLDCHDAESDTTSFTTAGIFRGRHGHRGNPRAPFGAGGLQCEACHGPGGRHATSKGGGRKGTIIDFKPGATPGTETRNAPCLECHQSGARTGWHAAAHDRAGLACVDCHQLHTGRDAVLARGTQSAVCFNCHKQQRADFLKTSAHPVHAARSARTGNSPGQGQMSCSDCHAAHGSQSPAMLVKPTINQTCFTCHAEKRGPLLWEHAPVVEDCTLCHASHGSVRQALLNKSPPLLCQQCHSVAGHPSVPRTGAALPGAGGGGAIFIVAGSCTNCHSQVHGSNHPAGAKLMR